MPNNASNCTFSLILINRNKITCYLAIKMLSFIAIQHKTAIFAHIL